MHPNCLIGCLEIWQMKIDIVLGENSKLTFFLMFCYLFFKSKLSCK